ncbi:MAG: tRNA 2-methylthio-N6-isopentenyl adenosine(37) hydroxylase MiaE [Nitrospiraceae bacterium]|nr:tRNA 2-methylthio-N6-isopentenyl adenosine(37) hydroxylase MiaE [Nitrospiraceae bacterium]|tara:strand:+ start:1160 stop:1771 length:612 start_codon:yes stop_codon:yes gene_type:complete
MTHSKRTKTFTLGLKLATDPSWVNIAEMSIEDILVDHAYCEQKATSSTISLIVKFPEKEELVEQLTPIVAEEWHHFKLVMDELRKRGLRLGMRRADRYVKALQSIVKTGGTRDDQLLEKLLVGALIEARSCERFRLLWKYLDDQVLRDFYHEMMVAEAGHYKLYLRLANLYLPAEMVEYRWRELLAQEADIMNVLPPRHDRLH